MRPRACRDFSSVLSERVIRIAVQPALAGLGGGDDRVSAGAGVFGGVAVGGVVAAEGHAAFLAGAQMDPSRAGLDAFLALVAFGGLDVDDRVEMRAGAFVHEEMLLPPGREKAW